MTDVIEAKGSEGSPAGGLGLERCPYNMWTTFGDAPTLQKIAKNS